MYFSTRNNYLVAKKDYKTPQKPARETEIF